jgi:hypothetical protein
MSFLSPIHPQPSHLTTLPTKISKSPSHFLEMSTPLPVTPEDVMALLQMPDADQIKVIVAMALKIKTLEQELKAKEQNVSQLKEINKGYESKLGGGGGKK